MRVLFFAVCLLLTSSAYAQHKYAYKIYTKNGKAVNYEKMINMIARQADVVLFGEIHNNAIAHWLQLEMIKSLHPQDELILGAEMLEADDQDVLNLYLQDSISHKQLDSLAGLWPNYDTDYAPLVNFAKENNLPFVATNIPRRYANLVYRGGFEALDTLSDQEKEWIAPLPVAYDPELPGYQQMLEMGHGHGGENLPKAQAIKDATMAHFILENYKKDHVFIHFNGKYHSDNFEGMVWYLKNNQPDLKYLTISTTPQENLDALLEENEGVADFIIVVDEDMTKTY